MTQHTTITRSAPRRVEYRAFDARVDTDGGTGFDGHASTSWHVDSYGTAFAPGAWGKTIAERSGRVVVLWQHDAHLPIGRPTRLEEDADGLAVTALVSEATSYGRDALALLRDGVPLGLSVGFSTIRDREATDSDPLILDNAPDAIRADPGQVRVIEEARLYEFSLVSFPANEAATVTAVRGDDQHAALSGLLADLRAGRVAPLCRTLMEELVAAWREAPDGSRPAPRNAKAPRRIDVDLALAIYGHMAQLEGV